MQPNVEQIHIAAVEQSLTATQSQVVRAINARPAADAADIAAEVENLHGVTVAPEAITRFRAEREQSRASALLALRAAISRK